MIYLQDAIRALDSSIVTIRGTLAYDANDQEVTYDTATAEAKLAELQATAEAEQESAAAAKTSALSKLAKLGLTDAEIKALTGN